MFESAPNGYFVRDLIVFHGLRKGCHVSKGFIIEPADLSAAAPEHLNAFQDQLALLLACLHDKLRLQVQWFCDSDYRADLLALPRADRTRDECLDAPLSQRALRPLLAGDGRSPTSPATARALLFAKHRDVARVDGDSRATTRALRCLAPGDDDGVRAAPAVAGQCSSRRAHHADE